MLCAGTHQPSRGRARAARTCGNRKPNEVLGKLSGDSIWGSRKGRRRRRKEKERETKEEEEEEKAKKNKKGKKEKKEE